MVLILLLMEYGLRDLQSNEESTNIYCLNPSFNGIWSARRKTFVYPKKYKRLNPSFNGIWSARGQIYDHDVITNNVS